MPKSICLWSAEVFFFSYLFFFLCECIHAVLFCSFFWLSMIWFTPSLDILCKDVKALSFPSIPNTFLLLICNRNRELCYSYHRLDSLQLGSEKKKHSCAALSRTILTVLSTSLPVNWIENADWLDETSSIPWQARRIGAALFYWKSVLVSSSHSSKKEQQSMNID